MDIDRIFDKTINGLSKALDLTWRRNQVLSSNVANAETPQYRASDLNFAGELDRAYGQDSSTLAKTNSQHLDTTSDSGLSHLVPDYSGATKPDGNNVDMDIEMGRLSFNSGKYQMATALIRRKIDMIKGAIREGSR